MVLEDAFDAARPQAEGQGVEIAHIDDQHARGRAPTRVKGGPQHGGRGRIHHHQRGIDPAGRIDHRLQAGHDGGHILPAG